MSNKINFIVDSHIHIGQFNNQYYSSTYVSKLMSDVGVNHYAVSSTTMCEENYQKVLAELHELIKLDEEKVLPVMWITPEGLKGNIAWFLESDIKWKCLKVHPELHPNDWEPNGSQFAEVIDIANELSLPIMIHTGNKECCFCEKYESLVKSNLDTRFILAHGRPLSSAIKLAMRYDNAFVDSAFMPVEDMKMFIDNGLAHKLLWGTDMCIPKYYFPKDDMVKYYKRKLQAFQKVCTVEQYELVTNKNAIKLFKIK